MWQNSGDGYMHDGLLKSQASALVSHWSSVPVLPPSLQTQQRGTKPKKKERNGDSREW